MCAAPPVATAPFTTAAPLATAAPLTATSAAPLTAAPLTATSSSLPTTPGTAAETARRSDGPTPNSVGSLSRVAARAQLSKGPTKVQEKPLPPELQATAVTCFLFYFYLSYFNFCFVAGEAAATRAAGDRRYLLFILFCFVLFIFVLFCLGWRVIAVTYSLKNVTCVGHPRRATWMVQT